MLLYCICWLICCCFRCCVATWAACFVVFFVVMSPVLDVVVGIVVLLLLLFVASFVVVLLLRIVRLFFVALVCCYCLCWFVVFVVCCCVVCCCWCPCCFVACAVLLFESIILFVQIFISLFAHTFIIWLLLSLFYSFVRFIYVSRVQCVGVLLSPAHPPATDTFCFPRMAERTRCLAGGRGTRPFWARPGDLFGPPPPTCIHIHPPPPRTDYRHCHRHL